MRNITSIKPGMVRLMLSVTVIIYHITKFVFIGPMAVLCFFVLSGYWISLMYEKKYTTFSNSLCVFYTSRVWRIFPVYYLFSVMVAFVYYIYQPNLFLAELSSVKFYICNFILLGYNLLPIAPLVPAWSLDIEMQFYIIFPFLFLAYNNKNKIYITFILFILSCVLLHYNNKMVVSKTILFYLVFFWLGILLYKTNFVFNQKVRIFTNTLFLIILAIHYIVPSLFSLVKDSKNLYHYYFNFYMSFLTIPFLINSVKIKSSNFDKSLGDLSFIVYLSHIVLMIPYNYYTKDYGFLQKLPYSFLFVFSTFATSYLVYRLYDRPIEALRKNWVENQKKLTF